MGRSLLILLFLPFAACAIRDGGQPPTQVETLEKTTRTWNGSILPAYPKGQPEVTILRITIAPGTRLPLHEHPVINAGMLLAGELTVSTPRGETKVLKAGDTLVELVDQPHFGENTGRHPAVILVFYAGVKGEPITVLLDAKSDPVE